MREATLQESFEHQEAEAEMNRMPKVMLLSWGMPPGISGSCVIIQNLARQFKRHEMVVVGAYWLGSPPVTWSSDCPSLVYVTIQPPFHWRGGRWIRWAQWPWLFLRTWWIMLVEKCRVILVVFPNDSFLLAGFLLAKMTRTPLYAYFHNTYAENRAKSRLARWLQPRVFKMAQHVFVMSEGMEALYREKYPEMSCSALVHSFHESLPEPYQVSLTPLHRPLRLVLFGNINASNAEAATRISRLVQTTPDVYLTLLSGNNPQYLKQLGFTGARIRIKAVSRDVLLEHLIEQDIVLLAHGFHGAYSPVEIATIFPTRTIEALISQRPILAHLPKDCFLAEFLRRHDCALIVHDPDVEALRQALERLCRDGNLRDYLVRQALRAARQFQAPTVAAQLRQIIQNGTHTSASPAVCTSRSS